MGTKTNTKISKASNNKLKSCLHTVLASTFCCCWASSPVSGKLEELLGRIPSAASGAPSKLFLEMFVGLWTVLLLLFGFLIGE